MVTKRKTPRKARRRTPVRRAAPRRRAKSGITYIPAAAATVGLVAANANNIKADLNFIQSHNLLQYSTFSSYGKDYVMNFWKKYVTVDNLTKSAIGYGVGYVGGELVKKYAPGVVKRPLGKIAKKIPKV